ncbi:MAG: hypothetical protein HUJ94_07995 [Bacteroidales bacterium]|nr:hypothetical protein [Bacteroidales bacterium]
MRKITRIMIAAAAAFSLCSCDIRNEINELHRELDDIKFVEVPSINKQLESIDTTILYLQATDDALFGFVGRLHSADTALNLKIEASLAAIEDARLMLLDTLGKADAAVRDSLAIAVNELNSLLASYRTAIDSELKNIDEAIDGLEKEDLAIKQEIEDLKVYADTCFENKMEWMTATFTSLEKYSGLNDRVALVSSDLKTLQNALVNLDSGLEKRIADAFDQMKSSALLKMKEETGLAMDQIGQAVQAMKAELESSFAADLKTALDNSGASLRQWFNGVLADYPTALESDKAIAEMKTLISGKLQSQKTYFETNIETLTGSLDLLMTDNEDLVEELCKAASSLTDQQKVLLDSITAYETRIRVNSAKIVANATDIDLLLNDHRSEKTAELISENEKNIAANRELIDSLLATLDATSKWYAKSLRQMEANEAMIASHSAQILENSAAIAENAESIAANSASITELSAKMDAAKRELLSAFSNALEEAIKANEVRMLKSVSDRFQNASEEIDRLMSESNLALKSLNDAIDDCEKRLDAINTTSVKAYNDYTAAKTDYEKFVGRLRSIGILPYFTDGSVPAGRKNVSFDVEICPVEALTELEASDFEVRILYSDGTSATLPASALGAVAGVKVMTLNFAGEGNVKNDFFSGKLGARISVGIKHGVSDISSTYVALSPVADPEE